MERPLDGLSSTVEFIQGFLTESSSVIITYTRSGREGLWQSGYVSIVTGPAGFHELGKDHVTDHGLPYTDPTLLPTAVKHGLAWIFATPSIPESGADYKREWAYIHLKLASTLTKMDSIDVTDPKYAAREVLHLFFEQLFGYHGNDPLPFLLRNEPYHWARATRDSYELWMSYAVLELSVSLDWRNSDERNPDPRRLRLGPGARATEGTSVHDKFLGKASESQIEDYFDWAFTKSEANRIRDHFRGPYRKNLVSPIHFWFFMLCRRQNPLHRPLNPNTTNDLFFHQLFSTTKIGGTGPLVVPVSFFKESGTARFYMFPFFAHRLFKYVDESATNPNIEPFHRYYTRCEVVWITRDNVDVGGWIQPPHPVLKSYWRWEEVLMMLFGLREHKSGPKPNQCDRVHGCGANEGIVAYLEWFAWMAKAWKSRA